MQLSKAMPVSELKQIQCLLRSVRNVGFLVVVVVVVAVAIQSKGGCLGVV